MNKQELLSKLKKNRDIVAGANSQSPAALTLLRDKLYIYEKIIDYVEKLDEPQKVKVPLFVAKWIAKCRELNWILPDLLAPEAFESSFARNTEEWLRQDKQNYDILTRAWLDGYEVEEEPKYQVKLKFGRQYLSKNADGTALDFYACMHPIPSFSKSELSEIEDGAFYKADGDKEWINPIIELVPVEKA